VLYTLDRDGVKDTFQPDGKFVAFAVRPCDADAVKSIDKIFEDETTGYIDPYFAAKRQNGVLIALACKTPCPTCFCTSVGSGPSSEKGTDILMTRLEDSLLFKACTDKGLEVMKANVASFKEASAEERKSCDDKAAEVAEKVNKVNTEGVTEKLAKGFNFKVWNDMFTRCLGCGVCTYVCPTCHCFDISDEVDGTGEGQRVRAWDACQFSLFTLHASGHNPRPSKKERMRQRIMHKFSYTVENFDEIFCVGCGRCVRSCPVNLDIREMIETIRTWNEPKE
jgi:Pyruvate/2-oxoacid:ferredoxin oxidoreductase delta subunit